MPPRKRRPLDGARGFGGREPPENVLLIPLFCLIFAVNLNIMPSARRLQNHILRIAHLLFVRECKVFIVGFVFVMVEESIRVWNPVTRLLPGCYHPPPKLPQTQPVNYQAVLGQLTGSFETRQLLVHPSLGARN